jgi:hypothetical protein
LQFKICILQFALQRQIREETTMDLHKPVTILLVEDDPGHALLREELAAPDHQRLAHSTTVSAVDYLSGRR